MQVVWTDPALERVDEIAVYIADIFRNRQDATDFIDAFKTRHPEPGWVVYMRGTTRQEILNRESSEKLVEVPYWSLGEFDSSDGALTGANGHVDMWRATATDSGITWQYDATRR